MKEVSTVILIFTLFSSFGQINPSLATVSNKSYSPAQAVPTDYRSMYFDVANFKMRPYQNVAEVLGYLNVTKYRFGDYPIYINSGGTLVNGTFVGGVVNEYWFRNCTDDSCLVQKQSSASMQSRPFLLASSYGAIGDGVTDNRIPLQNAINAAALVNGIVLLDSPGTYISGVVTISSLTRCITMSPNVSLFIPPNTVLKQKANTSINGHPVTVVHIPDTSVNVYVGWPFGNGGIVDANKDNQSGWTGGYSQSGGSFGIGAKTGFNGITIENITVQNTFSNSINLGGNNNYALSKNATIKGVTAKEFGEGIQIIGTDNVFINNVVHIMNKDIVVGDALELAFCRNFMIYDCVTRTKDSSSITVGGSGFDLYASKNGAVNNFYVQGTVYGNQTETDFTDTSHHPDNIAMSNIIMRDINFSPFVWTGGNITASNVQILNNRFSGPQLSRNNKSGANYRFSNYFQQGRGTFYIGDSIKVTGDQMTFVLDSAVDAVFSVNTSELDINGVQIQGVAGAPLQVVDNTHPYGRFIGISTNINGVSAIPIISSGSGVVDVDSLLIMGAPAIKATNGSPVSMVGCGAADIVGSLNSSNIPRGSKDQIITLTGIYGVSIANGARIKLLNSTNVVLATAYDQIVLQYGSDDIWREVSRAITSIDSRPSLQSVTDIGSTTTHLLSLNVTTAPDFSGLRMYNDQGKYFDLGYGNSLNGFGTKFRLSHSSGSFILVDSASNMGFNTTPAYAIDILRGSDNYIRLSNTGAFKSGLQYYTNNTFRGLEEYDATGLRYGYHASSNSFWSYTFLNGNSVFGSSNPVDDGHRVQVEGTFVSNDSADVKGSLRVIKNPGLGLITGVFRPGPINLQVGSVSNHPVDIISNNIPIVTIDPTYKANYRSKPFLVSTDTLTLVYKKYVDSLVATVSGGGGSSNRNIYNTDSTLSANRTVTMSARTLNFTGGYVGISQAVPKQALHIHGQFQLDTLTSGSTSDSILVTNNGLIKRVAQISVAGNGVGRNIYNADSTISANRTVTMSGRTLNFTGGYVGISQAVPSQALHVHGQIQLDTTATGTTTDSVIVVNGGLLKKVLQSAITGVNIYNADGTLTGNRTATFGSNTLKNSFDASNYSIRSISSAGIISDSAVGTAPAFRLSRSVADAVTALTVNNANASSTGLLIDAQLNSVSKFNVTSAGVLTTAGNITSGGSLTSGGGILSTFSNTTQANLYVTAGTSAVTNTTSQNLFSGWTGVTARIIERGTSTPTVTVGDAYVSHMIGLQTATEAASGTHPFMGQLFIRPLTITNGTATTTDAATVTIEGPLTGITPTTTNDAFRVVAGNTRLGGDLLLPVTVTSAGTLTLSIGGHYVFNGTTTTWTLPAITGSTGKMYFLKNKGSGTVTINSNAGGNDIYSTSAVATYALTAGSSIILISDGTTFDIN